MWCGAARFGRVSSAAIWRLLIRAEEARLHLDKPGVKLTRLTPEQAAYIGVKQDGPYEPEHYRY